jgi:two-component sensor histidine kinase
LLIGITEAVTNAQRHGRPPVTVRIWVAPDRIVVTVHDTGHGPADPLAGLVPGPGSTPDRRLGMGLWVMHQLDLDIALRRTDGFTVRLRHLPGLPGRPPPRASGQTPAVRPFTRSSRALVHARSQPGRCR